MKDTLNRGGEFTFKPFRLVGMLSYMSCDTDERRLIGCKFIHVQGLRACE